MGWAMTLSLVRNLPYTHPHRWDGSLFGYPTLWRPSQLGSALALWLDAEDASTITLNGSTVSQWADKSGNGRNVVQATATAQPVYQASGFNSRPTVKFDGTNDSMLGASTQTGFFITVLSPGATSFGAPLSFNTKHGLIRNSTTNDLYFSVQSMFQSTSARRNAALSTVIGAGATVAIFSQGGTASSNPIQLGTDVAGGSFTDCAIAEVVLLSSEPSDSARQLLEGYLAWKWLLEGSLPADHPYKNVPPTV